MKIIGESKIPVAQLRPAARNANKMEPARYEMLRTAIARDGFVQPVLVRRAGVDGSADCEIVDGHHRVKAASDLKFNEVPCVVVDCDDKEAALIAVSMNRLRGELDLTEVSAIFSDLLDSGVDPELLAATGFSQEQVDTLIAAAQETDHEVPPSMDAVPDEPTDGPTKPWILELEFADRKEYQRAKRGLKRAAGQSNELSAGLLRLLEGEAR